jgi:hypothetical protein
VAIKDQDQGIEVLGFLVRETGEEQEGKGGSAKISGTS